MSWARLAAGCLVMACMSAGACASPTVAEPDVSIKSSDLQVVVGFDPFVVRIFDAKGREVLRTARGAGDTPYGTPAATRDDGVDGTKLLPGWDAFVPVEAPWKRATAAKLVSQSDTSISVEMKTADGVIAYDVSVEPSKVTLLQTAKPTAPAERAWNKVTTSFILRDDEHFFGLGERYASVDHRGLSLYAWPEEGGLGQGENTPRSEANPFPNGPSMTYFPVPFLLSSAGYGVRFDTTYRTETHLGSERPEAWRVAANTTTLKMIVYVHDDPLASIDDYTRETGRPMIPAPWVFGPRRRISLGYQVGGVDEWRLLRSRGVPTTVIDDATHFLPHRSELGREAELSAWTKTLHEWGFKVTAYNNPYVSLTVDKAAPDATFGKEHGFFAKNPDGTVGETFFISGQSQTVATIDLLNPDAVAWFQDMLRRTLALGYDGWMHDFGEYVRRPWTFFGGKRGDEVHDLYPVLSAKAAHDLLVKERPDDFLFYVRSGYAGTQQYVPAVWGGDPEATFDVTQGLPAMLRGGLNLGMGGVAVWGSDITGFKCITDFPNDKEVHLRWAEVGAVSPMMHQEDACSNPVTGSRQKWKLWDDDETVQVYGAMARLHTRLLPYWQAAMRQANATGVPIMRHPFLLHPTEPEAWKAESTFYLGPSLWAAPVVARNERTKDTWLPPGKWVDWDDYTVYEGGKHVQIPAPLAKLPLLVKDGGIVPLLDPTIDTLAPATEASVVTIDKVKDRLDVVVALSAGRDASITLADGTRLTAKRAASAQGNPGAIPEVAADQVAACPGPCANHAQAGGVDRLRVTTALAPASSVTIDDVVLEVAGAPLARRVRWDVLRLR